MTTTEMVDQHLADLAVALEVVRRHADEVVRWGDELHGVLDAGGRVVVAGNGGSAALAAHLTGELVGRFAGERRPLSAVWLGADQIALTAIVNDYGADAAFARQVEAHARPGDVVLLLSTSGRSRNVIAAAEMAARVGARCWSMTGSRPNDLANISDRVLDVPGSTAVVQEAHQVLVHLLCAALDECFMEGRA